MSDKKTIKSKSKATTKRGTTRPSTRPAMAAQNQHGIAQRPAVQFAPEPHSQIPSSPPTRTSRVKRRPPTPTAPGQNRSGPMIAKPRR